MKKLTDMIEAAMEPNGFAILKPGFIEHKDEFIELLKKNGWDIVQTYTGTLTEKQAAALYKQHKNEKFYPELVSYMCSGNVFCCVCLGQFNNPIEQMNKLKEKVRKKWGVDALHNAMHSSDSVSNVQHEYNICCYNIVESKVNESLPGKNEMIIEKLKQLYAEEIIAWYQYISIAPFLGGVKKSENSLEISDKYLYFANDEFEDHAMWLARKLNAMGASPDDILSISNINSIAYYKAFIPDTDERSLPVSLKHNIEAETNAIKHYEDAITLVGYSDIELREKLIHILEDEKEHLAWLQETYDKLTQSIKL